jgi:FkbM family methyltransferase
MDRVVDDLIYDVGLHRGEDTAYYLAKGYRVVAFEAHPALVSAARRRFARALAEGQLEIIEGAISDAPGDTVTFYVHSVASEWGTVDRDWLARNDRLLGRSEPVLVPKVNFAQTLVEKGVPTYMKIDIEGADAVCLEALRDCTQRPLYVSIESSKTASAFRNELEMLKRLGYGAFAVVQQASIGGSIVDTYTRSGQPFTYQFESAASGLFGSDIQRWTDLRGALRSYRVPRAMYAVFGDRSLIRRTRIGNRAIARLSAYSPIPLPGWYDTHARRQS